MVWLFCNAPPLFFFCLTTQALQYSIIICEAIAHVICWRVFLEWWLIFTMDSHWGGWNFFLAYKTTTPTQSHPQSFIPHSTLPPNLSTNLTYSLLSSPVILPLWMLSMKTKNLCLKVCRMKWITSSPAWITLMRAWRSFVVSLWIGYCEWFLPRTSSEPGQVFFQPLMHFVAGSNNCNTLGMVSNVDNNPFSSMLWQLWVLWMSPDAVSLNQ